MLKSSIFVSVINDDDLGVWQKEVIFSSILYIHICLEFNIQRGVRGEAPPNMFEYDNSWNNNHQQNSLGKIGYLFNDRIIIAVNDHFARLVCT